MRFQSIRIKELEDFVTSAQYKQAAVLPITQHRAYSQVQNPRAQPNDVALVLAYEGEELVAYLGVLPDTLYLGGQALRCGWMSCIWVDSNMRGRGLAKKLLYRVLEAWDNRILATDFTPAAKSLYDKTQQFADLSVRKGLRGYVRPDFAQLLARRSRIFKTLKPALHLLDRLLDLPNSLRLAFHSSRCPPIRYVSTIDEEAWYFIQSLQSEELLRRGKKELEWIVRYPWLLSTPLEDTHSSRYYFSARAKNFQLWNIKVYDAQQRLAAFLMLSFRDGHLKVPYAYYRADGLALAAETIKAHLLKSGAKMLTVFQEELVQYFQSQRSPFFLTRRMEKGYLISKVFEAQLAKQGRFRLQDGDGDAAFT